MSQRKPYPTVVLIILVYLNSVSGEARTCYFGPPPEPDPNNPDPHHWMKQALPEIRKNCPGKHAVQPSITSRSSPTQVDVVEPQSTTPANAVIRKLVCNGGFLSISCAANEAIDVKWALYGREEGNNKCMTDGQGQALSCGSTITSLVAVHTHCQGKQSCEINVSPGPFDGDPCSDIQKYLVVHYVCNLDI